MKKNKKPQDIAENINLDIPEDEIWTYQIEGLAPPHIDKPYKNATKKKIFFTIAILVAISCSIYFSMRAVNTETITFTPLDNGYEWTKFTNTGDIREITIDYVTEVEYEKAEDGNNAAIKFNKDETKPISAIHEFAFNGDNVLETITIGKDVQEIDGKALYSCWNLRNIYVDEENEFYCDIDGVLYNKDKTELICYPIDHDAYLRATYGYEQEMRPDNPNQELYKSYTDDVLTYVVPSTVKVIGELAFNYANLAVVYFPEGLEKIETLAFFKPNGLKELYSYKAEDALEDTSALAVSSMSEIYGSMPSTLTYIGSDAFSYGQDLQYFFIPKSVRYIGHHAFWNSKCSDRDDTSETVGIHIEMNKEDFSKIDLGEQWYNKTYFSAKKSLVFGEERALVK